MKEKSIELGDKAEGKRTKVDFWEYGINKTYNFTGTQIEIILECPDE